MTNLSPYLEMEIPDGFKSRYPFKFGTTSYIFPDHIAPNARRLAPFIDEIELVLFQGLPVDQLPSPHEIEILSDLSGEFDLSYNVHLPIDVNLTDLRRDFAEQALRVMRRAIEITEPLSPSVYTLHLPCDLADQSPAMIEHWRERAYIMIERLLADSVEGRRLSIETLDYPFSRVYPLASALGLSICLDIGHLIDCHQSLSEMYAAYGHETAIIHLHGFKDARDHRAIDELPQLHQTEIIDMLRTFTGSLSLEVFSYQDFYDSLKHWDVHWRPLLEPGALRHLSKGNAS